MFQLLKRKKPIKTQLTDEIFYIDNFLSKRECALILDQLKLSFWQPSLTYIKRGENHYRNIITKRRVSKTTHQKWFTKKMKSKIDEIEQRILKAYNIEPVFLETWQATDYPIGGLFDYHLDAGYWDSHFAGDRIHTFLIYLVTSEKGGGTHFRAIDKYVESRQGRLLVWNNLYPNGNCNHKMIHSSVPLLSGNKTTLVTWQRQKRFRIEWP